MTTLAANPSGYVTLADLVAAVGVVITPRDAAQLLGVTRQRIYQRIAAGDLPAYRVGGRMYVPLDRVTPARRGGRRDEA